MRKELEKVRGSERSTAINELLTSAESVGGVKIITGCIEGLDAKEMRQAVDVLKNSGSECAAVLASTAGEKVSLIAFMGAKAQLKGLKAGDLVREVAKVVGGGGGGRPDVAQAGGTNVANTNDALKLAQKLIREKLAN
jgi:alanyl-tRNA synthetase